ncbi:IS30 family transposase [Patescibacteria group bacterium]|nr:IS30 family transposase [Patescibacteria group bacterium]MBU2259349.1 IS30 family transposase [Patescibacteria group bacterium]
MTHLTFSQRHQLQALHHFEHSQQEIADLLGCHQTTISRELKRSSPLIRNRYTATTAQKKSEKRRAQSYDRRECWYDNPDVLRYIVEELRAGESPDSIAGRMKRKSPWHKKHAVSHEAIYQYIWKVKEEGGVLHRYLPRKGKHPKFYGLKGASASQIPNRNDIKERPKEVEKKKRCGDWESDLIVSPRGRNGAVATFVERYSKYLQAVLLKHQTADEMVRAATEVFSRIPKECRLTMTHDNGSEITKHEDITASVGITVYCAEPYSSWQRGLNERMNGMLRRYFPKGTDFSQITQEEIAKAVEKINNSPRRSLNFLTPKEVFHWKIKDYAFQS